MTTELHAPKQHRVAAAFVALLMLLLALSLWTAIPLAWLWIGSQLAATQFPSMGPYAVVLGGVVLAVRAVIRSSSRRSGAAPVGRGVFHPGPPDG